MHARARVAFLRGRGGGGRRVPGNVIFNILGYPDAGFLGGFFGRVPSFPSVRIMDSHSGVCINEIIILDCQEHCSWTSDGFRIGTSLMPYIHDHSRAGSRYAYICLPIYVYREPAVQRQWQLSVSESYDIQRKPNRTQHAGPGVFRRDCHYRPQPNLFSFVRHLPCAAMDCLPPSSCRHLFWLA